MSYKLKTEHYEIFLKSGDMERCLENFAYHLEEPSLIFCYKAIQITMQAKLVSQICKSCFKWYWW